MSSTPPSRSFGTVGVVRTHVVRLELPPGGYVLDNGARLTEIDVAYETYGRRSASDDNVVFVCHALSGSAHAAGQHEPADPAEPAWWDEMIGPGRGIDTSHYHVICANILGGCKGTTGPASAAPDTGKPYGSRFPDLTVGDVVGVHRLLLLQLGIRRLAAVVGGSFGGMQVLEWAIRFPGMVARCIIIASCAGLTAQALAFDIVGRKAIQFDPDWQNGDYYGTGKAPVKGLSLARKVGHITYLSREIMAEKFGRERWTAEDVTPGTADGESRVNKFQVQTYLEHQGEKFTQRFDANSYLKITRAMDEYDAAARHGSLEAACARIEAKVLVVAASSDWLFPPEQSTEITNAMVRAGKAVSYCLLTAPYGHDAFLVDVEHLPDVIRAFLPWVERPSTVVPGEQHASDAAAPAVLDSEDRREYQIITRMVRPGSRVLDLGCGSGTLLTMLAREKQTRGVGVEIDVRQVIDVIERGHEVLQADIDGGLAMIPDGSYDYAILSETLQVVRKPRLVLGEMLRVAKEGIVSFPNFANWRHRASLWLTGRMPKNKGLPFEWYDTPNIHLFTYEDFVELCRVDGIRILDVEFLTDDLVGKALVGLGAGNLGANSVLVRVTRDGREGGA
ncbi:MAG: homoserine O-acetyltransferase [Verrucomicrobia bacterium]|nr:homoserine O-acetyltransferase [Verrucomicrobiota bacterium]